MFVIVTLQLWYVFSKCCQTFSNSCLFSLSPLQLFCSFLSIIFSFLLQNSKTYSGFLSLKYIPLLFPSFSKSGSYGIYSSSLPRGQQPAAAGLALEPQTHCPFPLCRLLAEQSREVPALHRVSVSTVLISESCKVSLIKYKKMYKIPSNPVLHN